MIDIIYEYQFLYDGANAAAYEPYVMAQTFTPKVTHKITSVILMMGRTGTPGYVTVSIRKTSGGKPTGSNLCTSSAINGNLLPVYSSYADLVQKEFTFSDGIVLNANEMYSIIVTTSYAVSNNMAIVGIKSGTSVYDGGACWNGQVDGSWVGYSFDAYFIELGIPMNAGLFFCLG